MLGRKTVTTVCLAADLAILAVILTVDFGLSTAGWALVIVAWFAFSWLLWWLLAKERSWW